MGRAITDFSQLSPHERAARYRELAIEAENCAEQARTAQLHQSYLRLAEQWRKLANQTDAAALKKAQELAIDSVARHAFRD